MHNFLLHERYFLWNVCHYFLLFAWVLQMNTLFFEKYLNTLNCSVWGTTKNWSRITLHNTWQTGLTQSISHIPLFSEPVEDTLCILLSYVHSLFSICCAYTKTSLQFWIFCFMLLVCGMWICTRLYCVNFFLRSVDIISCTTGLYSLDSWFCCICFLNVFLALNAVFIFVLLNKSVFFNS